MDAWVDTCGYCYPISKRSFKLGKCPFIFVREGADCMLRFKRFKGSVLTLMHFCCWLCYTEKYGCNGCHSIGDVGGLVGPALDRAGFRLNDTWIYRWIRYPQGIKKHTRMPNLGFDDHDARAVTAYLETLRAPKPDKPIPLPE